MPGGDKGGGIKDYDPKKGSTSSGDYYSTVTTNLGASLNAYMPGTVGEVEQETGTEFGAMLEIWDPILIAILAGEL